MSRDHTQEALDEYYSTGIDPTGGDIGPDNLDETEQAFYAEESETKVPEGIEESPWAGIDRLEELIDQKLAEVEAMKKPQPVQMEEQVPVETGKKINWAGAIRQIITIVFFIVMLILIIKNL